MTDTATATITVQVFGPNLPRNEQGELHVHKPGCADGKKRFYAGARIQGAWTVEVSSLKDVVHAIYGPSDFCYDADLEWEDYAGDIHVFPCVVFP